MNEPLFLCATSRLAQTLRGEISASASSGTADRWLTPQAMTPGQWLAVLAEEARLTGMADLPLALDPYAEALLWEEIIAAALTEAAPLFDLAGMAASAAEAQALCRVWNLHPGGDALADEAKLFVAWQAEFERRCQQAGWLDQAGVDRQVIALIEAGSFALPAEVRFIGFDRPTPLEQRLAAALSARGVAVDFAMSLASEAPPAPRQHVHACADLAAECAAVAEWAAALLAADPTLRIGVVAPNLAAARDRLACLLDDWLHPALIRADGAEMPRSFNFSLGYALADLPLVSLALDLLALGHGRGKLEQARLSQLLLAGGWSGSESEADGRARLDAAMRRELPYFTSPAALLRLAERQPEALCPASMAALSGLLGVQGEASGKRSPAEWARVFRGALQAAGWPGERALSSPEYQARRAFLETLSSFGRFDALLGKLSHSEALRRLRELCRQRLFQPETRGRPAIQVLGVLESAGLQFDALWVMGMNDDQWPPAPRPNPLLPAELLRAAGASHASAEVELDFARRVHARLLASAPVQHFSYARADGNRVLRPSPLLAGLPAAQALSPQLPASANAFVAAACTTLDDALAPPVGPGEKVSGGSWVLRAQAICPAWAYYQYRLGADAMETPVEGLDPAARGTLVHGALEHFWRGLGNLAALKALDATALDAVISAAVEQAITVFEGERRQPLPARFRSLEASRLLILLRLWLSVEAERPGDFTVVACEAPAEVEIEGIKVRMVVDRIDRLADDRQVIIDYKTGAAIDVKNWASDRLTEPQLPIYAALVADDVAAVVFAKVLLDKPAFAGVADEAELLPGVQGVGDEKQKLFPPEQFPDWPAVVQHWRDRLHAIAREVGEGVAGVSFTDENQLRYCEVLPLLRLPERRRWLAERAASQGSAIDE